jgi:hypothetical protein
MFSYIWIRQFVSNSIMVWVTCAVFYCLSAVKFSSSCWRGVTWDLRQMSPPDRSYASTRRNTQGLCRPTMHVYVWIYIFLYSTAYRPALEPPSRLSNGYRGLFPRGESGKSVKLITHLHLVLRSRMAELYLHSPHVFMAWALINKLSTGSVYLFMVQYIILPSCPLQL